MMLLPIAALIFQIAASRAEVPPKSGVCRPFVKWRALVYTETASHEPLTPATLPVTTVEFWTGVDAADQVATTMSIANAGAFGATYIDGYHNTTYTRTFFPASRVLDSRYEFDCLQ